LNLFKIDNYCESVDRDSLKSYSTTSDQTFIDRCCPIFGFFEIRPNLCCLNTFSGVCMVLILNVHVQTRRHPGMVTSNSYSVAGTVYQIIHLFLSMSMSPL